MRVRAVLVLVGVVVAGLAPAASVPSSGYSPLKHASQWLARVEPIASYTPSRDR